MTVIEIMYSSVLCIDPPELVVGQQPLVVLEAHPARRSHAFPGGEAQHEIGDLRDDHDDDKARRSRGSGRSSSRLIRSGDVCLIWSRSDLQPTSFPATTPLPLRYTVSPAPPERGAALRRVQPYWLACASS